MTHYSSPIVGAKYHPPATLVLSVLPANVELVLEPEPDNPHDENAVKVLVKTASLSTAARSAIEQELPGFGLEPHELWSQERLFLGYIPRTHNEPLARAFRDMAAAHSEPTLPWATGSLDFDLTGRPIVKVELT